MSDAAPTPRTDLDTPDVLQLLVAAFERMSDPDIELARLLPAIDISEPKSIEAALTSLIDDANRD
jgi:hypothetical protein